MNVLAALGALERVPADASGKPHLVLGEVLAEPLVAEAVADGVAAVSDPGVVVGQGMHPLHAGVIMV